MKKLNILALLTTLIICSTNSIGQSWTKLSSNFDSLWTTSVNYYNHGDTIVYFGSTEGTGAFSPKRFYVSTNGGVDFTQDLTKLDNVGYNAFYSLPKSNLFLGFKNTPNVGTYAFASLNNWDTLFFDNGSGYGFWCDYASGKALFQPHGSDDFFLFDLATKTLGTREISDKVMARASITFGNQLFLGGKGGLFYLTIGDATSIKEGVSTTNNGAFKGDIVRFFVANGALFAVSSDGTEYLYKTTDDGATWTLIDTKFDYSGTPTNLTSAFTIGTPNGNIYYLNAATGNSNEVYVSKDGGLNASLISNGLPSTGLRISNGRNKLLTKGNKVWYHLLAAKTTDFITTDTAIAGLYLLNDATTAIEEPFSIYNNITIYPNPTSKILYINSTLTELSYQIINALGQTIESNMFNNNSLDLGHLNNGVYFIHIITRDGHTSTHKIIKD